MNTNAVDWSTIITDADSASSVAALGALAAGFDPQVPVVLIPVRIETRFTTSEVADPTDHLGELLRHLGEVNVILKRLADRPYATVLTGKVKEKKETKKLVEAKLYEQIQVDLEALDADLKALRLALQHPVTSGSPDQTRALTAAVTTFRDQASAALQAITQMRSEYQRARFVEALAVHLTAAEDLILIIQTRVVPTMRLVADLDVRTGANALRELGRSRDGRLMRADLLPVTMTPEAARLGTNPDDPNSVRPTPRVVLDDDTSAEAFGASRVVRLEHSQLVASAEAADLILQALADPTAKLDQDLQSAAASIVVLPGTLKAELLDKLDTASGRLGAPELRAEIASTPSDRPDLDAMVPERIAGTVWTLAGPTKTVHQLLVRIYPESLAVDSHEEDLTETERADGEIFWRETAAAGADDRLRKGAWRALCIGRSTRRAAWVARVTKPADAVPTKGANLAKLINEALNVLEKRLAGLDTGRTQLVAGERPDRTPELRDSQTLSDRQLQSVNRALKPVQSAVEVAAELPTAAISTISARLQIQQAAVEGLTAIFTNVPEEWFQVLDELSRKVTQLPAESLPATTAPTGENRSGTWTRAASSTVLPDRFAVFTINDGRAGKVAAGKRIPTDLKLGLNPGGDTFNLDDDGNMNVPDSIRWMTDFDEAVAKGMALRLTITAEEAEQGFDELLVLGLSDGDEADGQDRLTAMLEAQHYTGQGLSLLPVGTPTNNTEDERAGYSSSDDVDQAFSLELGPELVAAASDSDGLRLATAIGVSADVFAHIGGADGTDARDSLVANHALYPGSVGHALEELASVLISRDARDRLRSYALENVAARGLLPAIRFDDQPYGVLPVVAISRFRIDLRDAGFEAAPPLQQAKQLKFEETLLSLFRHFHKDWSMMRVGADGGPAVKHAHSHEVGKEGFDAQQHFLTMLGLEPSSVEASYRFLVNVADRGGVRGEPNFGLGFGIPSAGGLSVDKAAAFGPFALMEHLADVFRKAFGLPELVPPRNAVTGQASEGEWTTLYELIRSSRAFGLRLLNGLRPLQGVISVPAVGGSPSTATQILNLLPLNLDQLREQSTDTSLSNVGLATILVRQALLAEARRAAADILIERRLLSEEALAIIGTSNLYQTWSSGTLSLTSSWGLLFGNVNKVIELSNTGAAIPADLDNRTMSEVFSANRPAAVDVHRTAVTSFAQLLPDRMAALTREHLDLSSYRLDAWIVGLAHRRLRSMRKRASAGAQVGAYGWVENLGRRPTPKAPTDVPPALAGLPGRPLTVDPAAEGFIQTPSPTHAVTAAILRAAYRSQAAEGSIGNEMSINLSSNRVRVALYLIDGVRAGNDLGALLGYRLERFLHEYYARSDTPDVVELDSTIFPLRRAYPTVAAVNPSAAAVTEPTRHIIDGLALVRAILDWTESHAKDATGTLFQKLMARMSGYPWGTKDGALPDPNTSMAKLTGVLRGIDSIADAVDALGDLTTSETIYQLVRGNHARAAAVLAALSEGKAIPHPEVAETPRTGLPIRHKVLLQLPTVDVQPVVAPAGWDALPMTPRATLEPTLNAWLANLLGDPTKIRIRLNSDRFAPGAALPEVSVADLGLQPLDLVALLADGFDSAVGSLTARVLDLLRPADLPPDQPGVLVSDGPSSTATDTWRIEPKRAPAWGAEIRSITDLAPLLETCVDLIGRAKPARASDFAAADVTAVAGDSIDTDDLAIRVLRLIDGARSDVVTLAGLLAEDQELDEAVLDEDPAVWLGALRKRLPNEPDAECPSAWLPMLDFTTGTPDEVAKRLARLDGFWANREVWRDAAKTVEAYGIRVGLPRRFLSRTQVSAELLQSTEVAFLDLATRCRVAVAILDAVPDPKPVDTWLEVARALLGEGLKLVPRIKLDGIRVDLQVALDAHLVGADDLDAWLEGVAAVRPASASLADLQVLAEALGRPSIVASVAQLPHRDGDPWLGGPVPNPAVLTGKVSVVIFGSQHLPAAGASGSALLVDEWSESVPYREEVTGVALHYDQPDATAPQAILVAVPPAFDTPWTLTDFAATLHDTLELARNRTVEVEHIGASRYGQLLPLVVGEVLPNASVDGNAGDRVILDFRQNKP